MTNPQEKEESGKEGLKNQELRGEFDRIIERAKIENEALQHMLDSIKFKNNPDRKQRQGSNLSPEE